TSVTSLHHYYTPIRHPLIPKGRFVGKLQRLDFSPHCYPSYRTPTLTLAGLSPAEHTSLCWTHIPAEAGIHKEVSRFFSYLTKHLCARSKT
ncbi:MAG: hypothetical protein OXC48_04545, partial [Endozoicomonadaceae bacterium]|nr:hypothetical protein [Endozoicomonadaceae bacterium]